MSGIYFYNRNSFVYPKSNNMKTLLLYLSAFILSTIMWQNSLSQNYSLNFNGSYGLVVLPNTAQPTATNFTAESWIYLDPAGSGDQKVIINLSWAGGGRGFALNIYKDATGYYFTGGIYLNGSAYYTPNSAYIPVNEWTHIALTWQQNGNLTAYLNGQSAGSVATENKVYVNTLVTTYVGAGDSEGWANFKGKIDDVRFWNITRTQSEIFNNMQKELTGNESGLVAYYKMSNGTGATLSDDAAGNLNSGFIYPGVDWVTNSILPLRFISFNAESKTSDIQLSWVTADEINNSYFEVQRSVDGIHFNAIAFVDKKKYAGTEQQYNFSDATPFNGTNYYRLKQVDMNGSYSYSAIISVLAKADNNLIAAVSNPVTNSRLKLSIQHATLINIYNASGSLVYSKTMAAGIQEINVTAFSKGVYLVKANSEILKILIQ